MKKILRIIAVLGTITLLSGCGSIGEQTSNTENSSVVTSLEVTTEETTEKTTEIITEQTTEAKQTINDVTKELKEYLDSEYYQVAPQNDGKTIYIYEYFENFRYLMSRCRTDGDFSADSYEFWLDMKSTHKELSKSFSDLYPKYNITLYILDDEACTLPIKSGSVSYLASFTNGYCTFDYSD